jgi:Holliday junction DNA helicase RuvA
MIASLSGTVVASGKDFVVLQVGGVGFQVFVPQRLLSGLPGANQEITLFTHLHVRENELSLYGCESQEELSLFRTLLGVPGVGPKAGLSILSTLPPDQLRAALAAEDVALLARVPGIGRKTAQKLVFELKDKVAAEFPPGPVRPEWAEADADLIAVLTSLGYSVTEAQAAIRTLPRESLPLEERVRLALAYFAS